MSLKCAGPRRGVLVITMCCDGAAHQLRFEFVSAGYCGRPQAVEKLDKSASVSDARTRRTVNLMEPLSKRELMSFRTCCARSLIIRTVDTSRSSGRPCQLLQISRRGFFFGHCGMNVMLGMPTLMPRGPSSARGPRQSSRTEAVSHVSASSSPSWAL